MKTFKDIGGYAIQKEEAAKAVDFIKNFDFYVANGARLPRGILLFGDPGTGKSLFAEAIANESGAKIFVIGSDELQSETSNAATVRRVFTEAKKSKPSVIIIDEIEKLVGRNRYYGGSDSKETDALRTLLTEIDKDKEKSVLVIATSNDSPDNLPPALVREGRIEKHIHVPYPDVKEREEILSMYMSKSNIFRNVNPRDVAEYSSELTGAAIEHLVNEVLVLCLAKKKDAEFCDFLNPIESIKSSSIRTKEKLRPEVIYHEVGHFIADYVLNGSTGMINVVPYGSTAGRYSRIDFDGDEFDFVSPLQIETKGSETSFTSIKNQCVVCVAGLVADKIFLHEIFTGSNADLIQFNKYFKTMVLSGMMGSEITAAAYATEKSEKYDELAVNLFDTLYRESINKAEEIISSHKKLAAALYNALLKTPVLTHTDIQKIIDSVSEEEETE